MKVLSWNINGFTKANLSTIQNIVSSSNYDVLLFQETKSASVPLFIPLSDYETTLFPAKKMNQGGTLSATKLSPVSVAKGLGSREFDEEGRVMTLEFDQLYVVNAYFPFAGEKLSKLDSKLKFLAAFEEHVKKLTARKPVVICGDLNIARSDTDRSFGTIDMPGFSLKERDWLSKFLDSGFVDAFRFVNGDIRRYSGYWYNDKSQADRLDCSLVSKQIAEKIRGADILTEIEGSDHWPITLELA